MPEPKTTEEWNDAILNALDLECTCHIDGTECPHYDAIDKDFWTDPAAALWALERWREQNPLAHVMLTDETEGRWVCFLGVVEHGCGTFCEAICEAIVGAAE